MVQQKKFKEVKNDLAAVSEKGGTQKNSTKKGRLSTKRQQRRCAEILRSSKVGNVSVYIILIHLQCLSLEVCTNDKVKKKIIKIYLFKSFQLDDILCV